MSLCIFQIGVQIACAIKLILTKWRKGTSLKDSMIFGVTVEWEQQRKGEFHMHEYRGIWNTSQDPWGSLFYRKNKEADVAMIGS